MCICVYIYIYLFIYLFLSMYIHKCKDKLAPKGQRWIISMVRFTFYKTKLSQCGSSDKLHGVCCFQEVRPRGAEVTKYIVCFSFF